MINPEDYIYKLNIDFVNNGKVYTASGEIQIYEEELLDKQNLVTATLGTADKKLKLFFNGDKIGEVVIPEEINISENNTTFFLGGQQESVGNIEEYDDDTTFKGFIGETYISNETFSEEDVELLWNNGNGDFWTLTE
jgi:hypothetical protein